MKSLSLTILLSRIFGLFSILVMLKIFILFLTFQKRAHKLSLLAFLKVGCATKFSIFLKTQNLARVERRRLLTVSCRLFYRTK